jgi:hypothetical protein
MRLEARYRIVSAYRSTFVNGALTMTDAPIYEERISSNRTTLLFLALTALFALLLTWRVLAARFDALAIVFLCLSGLFLFYVVNYRTLVIRLRAESLTLTFGLFTWKVPLDKEDR